MFFFGFGQRVFFSRWVFDEGDIFELNGEFLRRRRVVSAKMIKMIMWCHFSLNFARIASHICVSKLAKTTTNMVQINGSFQPTGFFSRWVFRRTGFFQIEREISRVQREKKSLGQHKWINLLDERESVSATWRVDICWNGMMGFALLIWVYSRLDFFVSSIALFCRRCQHDSLQRTRTIIL